MVTAGDTASAAMTSAHAGKWPPPIDTFRYVPCVVDLCWVKWRGQAQRCYNARGPSGGKNVF